MLYYYTLGLKSLMTRAPQQTASRLLMQQAIFLSNNSCFNVMQVRMLQVHYDMCWIITSCTSFTSCTQVHPRRRFGTWLSSLPSLMARSQTQSNSTTTAAAGHNGSGGSLKIMLSWHDLTSF